MQNLVSTAPPPEKTLLRAAFQVMRKLPAWAQTRPETYNQEAAFVLQVMQQLSRQHPEVQLRLYDPQAQEGDFLDWFWEVGIQVEWRETYKYSDYLRSFDDVSLGFAPRRRSAGASLLGRCWPILTPMCR